VRVRLDPLVRRHQIVRGRGINALSAP